MPSGMDTRYTLCGRTALELVLRDVLQTRKIRKAYLPSYCCHTMIEPFIAKGIDVVFYDVFFTDIGIDCDFLEDNGCELIFMMDYFGFLDGETAQRAAAQKAKGKCVVYDATHAIFCENVDYSPYDYVFGSFRKWFDVNAGFCAKRGTWADFPVLTENYNYVSARNGAFAKKQQYMAGSPMDKRIFLDAFSQAEESLESDYQAYLADTDSLKKLCAVNVAFIRQKRRENAAAVIAAINSVEDKRVCSPYRSVGEDDCPLFVPVQVKAESRAALRKELISRQVYLPIHWPLSQLHKTNSISQKIYETELSFVCDQRYEIDDIDRAIKIIRSF